MYNLSFKPLIFSEMVGQDKTLLGLKKRAKDLNFPPFMMIEGESGAGKTTSAHIIARTINCRDLVINEDGYHDPCGKCDSCLDVINSNFRMDIQKISGSDVNKETATRLGRDLSISPFYCKNKVLIIEESHTISSVKAAEVFLDICDSIKGNVYIIFVTSKPETFKSDIQRRFQHFKFNKILSADIEQYLATVLMKLDLFETLPEEFIMQGLSLISEISEGSPGRAINILETCIYNEIYTVEDIEKEFNVVSIDKESEILEKLLQKDKSVLNQLQMIDLQKFYDKSKKTLVDSCVYKITGELVDEWKANTLNKIKNYGIIKLLNYYTNVYSKGYFDSTEFLYNMVRYFDDTNLDLFKREFEGIPVSSENVNCNLQSGQNKENVNQNKPNISKKVRTKKSV